MTWRQYRHWDEWYNLISFHFGFSSLQLPQWYPLTIVKAGAAANALVRGLETEWGKRLYAKTLIRNIAQSVYRDRKQIEKSFKSQVCIQPRLLSSSEYLRLKGLASFVQSRNTSWEMDASMYLLRKLLKWIYFLLLRAQKISLALSI